MTDCSSRKIRPSRWWRSKTSGQSSLVLRLILLLLLQLLLPLLLVLVLLLLLLLLRLLLLLLLRSRPLPELANITRRKPSPV